ncbi:alcohol dehydrogenase catalytic domain-containing protein [Candidatus Haliotispira prima]|uniref:Alcohol dehydrogenase catalytic domain-containing protein n=1 Tax=Candidatus Haliotispira prima TaxID=3034016 RepID=A0ABY8MGH1_9SPIO|nr:alcohol dehydrogenase catalytic domain-containing protein [Candidatus Haliotispira prima]
MRAAYYKGQKHFSVSEGQEKAPRPTEAKIRVAYCGICGTDLHIYHGKMDARTGHNRITGHECSGEIVELGRDVTDFRVGDRVVVRPLASCGDCPACAAGHSHICHNLNFMGVDSEGAFQEYWTVPAKLLHRVPEKISLKQAALAEPLAVACHDVRLGEVKAGEYVVVLGGGPIGLLVALVARERGARVLVSEINSYRLGLARELGLEAANPKEQDLVQLVKRESGTAGADVVFEVTGTEAGAELMTQLPKTRGRIVVVAIYSFRPTVDLFGFFWRELHVCGARVYEAEDFEESLRLLAEGLAADTLISGVHPLGDLQATFEHLEADPRAMKTLIDCRA